MTRSTRPLLAVLALLLAAFALAACGGDDSSGDSGSATTSEQDTALAFEECLQSRGMDVDISEEGGMLMRAGGPGESGPSQTEAERAMEDCRESTGYQPPEPSDEQRAEMRESALAFAQCMRAEGVDVPDPSPDGRMTLRMEAGNREAFERAAEKCSRSGRGGMTPALPTR